MVIKPKLEGEGEWEAVIELKTLDLWQMSLRGPIAFYRKPRDGQGNIYPNSTLLVSFDLLLEFPSG